MLWDFVSINVCLNVQSDEIHLDSYHTVASCNLTKVSLVYFILQFPSSILFCCYFAGKYLLYCNQHLGSNIEIQIYFNLFLCLFPEITIFDVRVSTEKYWCPGNKDMTFA